VYVVIAAISRLLKTFSVPGGASLGSVLGG